MTAYAGVTPSPKPNAFRSAADPRPDYTPSVGAGRILVIDDDEVLLNVVGRALRASGFQVLTAMSAEEGLDRFETLRPDCVIVDVYLPGLDGFAFVKRAHAIDPSVPLLMLSGLEGIENEHRAALAGARRFLPKAIDVRDLARHIRDAMASPSISGMNESPSVDAPSATAPRAIPFGFSAASATLLPTLDLGELERRAITQALGQTKGNRTQAARLLGIHVRTLHRKLREREMAGEKF